MYAGEVNIRLRQLTCKNKKAADIATGGSVVFPPQENSKLFASSAS
jgi:hypothetical protein